MNGAMRLLTMIIVDKVSLIKCVLFYDNWMKVV